jgi:L-arabinose transport system permease protein
VYNEGFILFAGTSFLGILLPIWVTVIWFVVFGVLLNKAVYGRNTLAIGRNPEATRLAGINVEHNRIIIFLIQGAVAALAGVILASRITSGQPNAAQGFKLNVISACVLGGVSLQRGRATISGVANGGADYGYCRECHETLEHRCVSNAGWRVIRASSCILLPRVHPG